MHNDVTLYDALRAACLVDRADAEEETIFSSGVCGITLDTIIEEEGSNLSLGQVSIFVTKRLSIDLTVTKHSSDVSSGWLVHWSRTLESSF